MSESLKELKRTPAYKRIRRKIKKSAVYQNLAIAGFSLRTNFLNKTDPVDLENVEVFTIFIGHGRSGHSIIGALIDAHPNAIVSDESDSLKYMQAGFYRSQLFRTLILRSERQLSIKRTKDGLNGAKYSYHVPGQWQGKYEELTLIGDSKASVTARRLSQDLSLLDQLGETTGCMIKVIHVIRNPFDNISTIAIRENQALDDSIKEYFQNCQSVSVIRDRVAAGDLITLRHEDLIADPKNFLTRLTKFLGLEPRQQYLEDCAQIIFKSTSKTRHKIEWEQSKIEAVQQQINDFEFLSGYSYLS